jgi:hypothetical protein
MGLVYSNIILSNPVKPELKSIEVRCLVDTGSTYLCIPQHLATQLQINIKKMVMLFKFNILSIRSRKASTHQIGINATSL